MGEHVPDVYRYKLEVRKNTRLRLRAAETRANGVKITAFLYAKPEGQRLITLSVGEARDAELSAEVPALSLDWKPRLSIWYRIDNIFDDVEGYSAECEFTSILADGTALKLLPSGEDEAAVQGTIGCSRSSFQITGKFASAWRPVAAYVDLVEGEAP